MSDNAPSESSAAQNATISAFPDQPNALDRLTMMWNLSSAARDRFKVRNETEWKICFGLWTGFGAAAGFVVNSTTWVPGWGVFWATFGIVAAICVVFALWTVKRRKFDEQDAQTAYFWESAIEKEIDRYLHGELHPSTAKFSLWWTPEKMKWVRYGQGGAKRPDFDLQHPGLVFQIVITVLFGILVIGAVGSVVGDKESTTRQLPNVELRGNGIEIEKMKLSAPK